MYCKRLRARNTKRNTTNSTWRCAGMQVKTKTCFRARTSFSRLSDFSLLISYLLLLFVWICVCVCVRVRFLDLAFLALKRVFWFFNQREMLDKGVWYKHNYGNARMRMRSYMALDEYLVDSQMLFALYSLVRYGEYEYPNQHNDVKEQNKERNKIKLMCTEPCERADYDIHHLNKYFGFQCFCFGHRTISASRCIWKRRKSA